MTNHPFKSGASREQASLLPARVEDYVGADNPVRAIDAYVAALDLSAFGFRHADRGEGVGQPPYDPADLLKLYLYGYLNGVRSSRRLEREGWRNVEVMWLLRQLRPGYRTIAAFRRENWSALKQVNRAFVLFARALGLVGGALVAIDGAFFDGNAGKASVTTRKKLAKQLAALDLEIEAYGAALETNDAAEARQETARAAGPGPGPGPGSRESGPDLAARAAALLAERAARQADLDRLEASGAAQLSRTDADARLLSKSGQVVAGYNVQAAVDDMHGLIVASEVVNDGNDSGQLHPTAAAAKEALGVASLQAVADSGYWNGPGLKACEEDGITAYVPPARRSGRLAAQGRFSHEDFAYDAEADVYRCPGGAALTPSEGLKRNGDRLERRYTSRKAACDACALRARCLAAKARTRTIQRWEHEDVLERHRARMDQAGAAMMRRRAALAEHPFGTLKCRAGYRHFLVRGFDRVRGEWSLMALAYNFTRVLNILGIDRFLAEIASRAAALASLFARGAVAHGRATALTTLILLIPPRLTPRRTHAPLLNHAT